MSVESVTQAVSNLALQFGDDDADPGAMVGTGIYIHELPYVYVCKIYCVIQSNFFYAYIMILYHITNIEFFNFDLIQSRPFGVALLFAGIDGKGPQL